MRPSDLDLQAGEVRVLKFQVTELAAYKNVPCLQ